MEIGRKTNSLYELQPRGIIACPFSFPHDTERNFSHNINHGFFLVIFFFLSKKKVPFIEISSSCFYPYFMMVLLAYLPRWVFSYDKLSSFVNRSKLSSLFLLSWKTSSIIHNLNHHICPSKSRSLRALLFLRQSQLFFVFHRIKLLTISLDNCFDSTPYIASLGLRSFIWSENLHSEDVRLLNHGSDTHATRALRLISKMFYLLMFWLLI